MEPFVVVLAAALGSGGFAAILKTIQWFVDRRRVNEVNLVKELVDVNKTYEILTDAKNKTKASRVSLIRLHNGGGRPVAGKPMYSSGIYEVYSDGKHPIAKYWQNERVDTDEQYRQMLIEMFDKEMVCIETTSMKQGKLKELYDYQNVFRSHVRKVGKRGDDFFYISATFEEPYADDKQKSRENVEMRVMVNRLKEILHIED